MNKKVIVTGGAGFIGSHLVDKLVADGHQVLVIDDLSYGHKEYVAATAEFSLMDIRDEGLGELVRKFAPDIIYHLAAQKNVRTSLEKPLYDAQINILGSLNLLQAALVSQVKKFIFVSTCGIYGDAEILPTSEAAVAKPLSPYILNKFTFEKYLEILAGEKMEWLALRLANVYGPRQDPQGEAGVIAIFLDNLLHNKILFINGDGQQTRDYIYVADVVDILVKGLEQGNGVYNVATGVQTALSELIQQLQKIVGRSGELEYRPAIVGEVRHCRFSTDKAAQTFSWRSKYDLPSGLELTYNWFKNKEEQA